MSQRVSFWSGKIVKIALLTFVAGVVLGSTLKVGHQAGTPAFAQRVSPDMVKPAGLTK